MNAGDLRCSYCDARCRNRAELAEHERGHRREDAETEPSDNETMEKAQ